MGLLDEFSSSADLGHGLLSAILGIGSNVAVNRYFGNQRNKGKGKTSYKSSQKVAGEGGYEPIRY